jgi:quinol monooxygenase YgiN
MIERRYFIAGSAALALSSKLGAKERQMFGFIGKMVAKPGQRDALMVLVLEGADTMPGCVSYIVAKDAEDENGIWITEVWENEESHSASLKLPSVAASISKAIPLIDMEAKGMQQKTIPYGGTGIK